MTGVTDIAERRHQRRAAFFSFLMVVALLVVILFAVLLLRLSSHSMRGEREAAMSARIDQAMLSLRDRVALADAACAISPAAKPLELSLSELFPEGVHARARVDFVAGERGRTFADCHVTVEFSGRALRRAARWPLSTP